MSDISITISSDPTQAIQGINKVKDTAKGLVDTSNQVNKAIESTSISVSQATKSSGQDVISVAGSIGKTIKDVTSDASKISSAFGSSVPAIGKIGGALQSIVKGPMGLVLAGVTGIVTMIHKMLDEVEARAGRLKAAAEGKTSRAYDALMAGRSEYAEQLKILDQVKQINSMARETGLSTHELADFRRLASQIGISERDVTARGIRSDAIGRAEAQMQYSRRVYSQEEYNDYLEALTSQFRLAVENADLPDKVKSELKGMSVFSAADALSFRSRPDYGPTMRDVPDMISNGLYDLTSNKFGLPVIGKPSTDQERKAYEELYSILKPLAEVRKTYNVDPMLGRTQEAVNAELFKSIQEGVKERQEAKENGHTVGGYSWRDMDRDAVAAEKKRLEEQARRTAAGAAIIDGMEQEIKIQELINQDKKREADQLKARFRMEEALGRELTEAERETSDRFSGMLYDLRNPAAAEESGLAPAFKMRNPENTVPLDRLQRIGANYGNIGAVMSPERMAMQRQVSLQEQIHSVLKDIDNKVSSRELIESVMRF